MTFNTMTNPQGDITARDGKIIYYWDAQWSGYDFTKYRDARAERKLFLGVKRSVEACRANILRRRGAKIEQPSLMKIYFHIGTKTGAGEHMSRLFTIGAFHVYKIDGVSIADEVSDHNDWAAARKKWAMRHEVYPHLFLKFRGMRR